MNNWTCIYETTFLPNYRDTVIIEHNRTEQQKIIFFWRSTDYKVTFCNYTCAQNIYHNLKGISIACVEIVYNQLILLISEYKHCCTASTGYSPENTENEK
jgi:hypothetical protein